MPTPIGHALAGLAVAEAVRPSAGKPAGLAWSAGAALLAALPDVDTLAGLLFAGGNFRAFHRGATHGLAFAALATALFAALSGRRFGFLPSALLAAAAILSHVGLDLLTGGRPPGPGYAVRLLEPFSDAPARLPFSLIPGSVIGPGSPPWSPHNLAVVAGETAVFGGLALFARRLRVRRG